MYKIGFYCLLVFVFHFTSCRTFQVDTSAHSSQQLYQSQNNKYFLISDSNGRQYLLDTGSSDSYLDADIIAFLRKNDYQNKASQSTTNKQKGLQSENILLLKFPSFSIKNGRFTYFPKNSPIRNISPKLVGIIGMNILNQKVSYWNIKEQTFKLGYILSKSQKPALTLRYFESGRIPCVDIIMNAIHYDDVVLDTGYYNFIRLKTNHSINFNSEYFVSHNNDMLGNSTKTTTYNTKQLTVNGYQLYDKDGLLISLGDFENQLLGYSFFAYWDYFIIDPIKKEFLFFKN